VTIVDYEAIMMRWTPRCSAGQRGTTSLEAPEPEIGGSGSDVHDTAAACGRSTVAASGGNRRLRQPRESGSPGTAARRHSSDQSSPADDVLGCPHIRIAAACSATTV